jgi:hypothetical protein
MDDGNRGTHSLRLDLSHPSKELKDPDQLYTTLKNLLAQIKVGRPGSLLRVPTQWLWDCLHTRSGVVASHWLGKGHSEPVPS